ncbi:hypothetical protein HHL22_12805 [Hymenobacter sp. RP-2-7]|uniref:DUF4476 domain-containing protein n=1 Tax=Hymenobacter polaris TaxID=2682546 RepID=A0A7Y0AEU8_9BACT|nr:hypothetical protein [Hymenobacter polaris]NML66086.1 hypothetical protein [Hymenobacter polaris]
MKTTLRRGFRLMRWWQPALLGGLLSAYLQPAAAQVLAAADSATVAASVAAATRTYTSALGLETVLYDGAEYVDYKVPGTRGHQFFGGPEAQTGSVVYRGGTFANLPLRYDLVRDQPVLLYPGQAVAIMLVPEKVASFTLGGHRFVRVVGDSLAAGSLPTGFYELLADGPVRLLVRHSKRVFQAIISQALTLEYRQTDALYLRTATATAEVANLKQLLALLPDHQAEVQRYARQQQLSFAPAGRVESAERLLRYYYTLRP